MSGKPKHTDPRHCRITQTSAWQYLALQLKFPDYGRAFPDRITVQKTGKHVGRLKCRVGSRTHFEAWVFDEIRKERKERNRLKYQARAVEHQRKVCDWIERRKAENELWLKFKVLRREAKGMDRKLQLLIRHCAKRRLKKPNMERYYYHQTLGAKRREARAAKMAFLEAWEKKYGFLFRRTAKAEKKRYRQIREQRAKAKRDPKVWKIKQRIKNAPQDCYWCGCKIAEGAEADHVIPLAAGGEDGGANLVPSCQSCNRRKNSTLPNHPEFPVSNQIELLLAAV